MDPALLRLSRRPGKWGLCGELRGSGACKFFKQVLPPGEYGYGKVDCPFGRIAFADGTDSHAVTLLEWI